MLYKIQIDIGNRILTSAVNGVSIVSEDTGGEFSSR